MLAFLFSLSFIFLLQQFLKKIFLNFDFFFNNQTKTHNFILNSTLFKKIKNKILFFWS